MNGVVKDLKFLDRKVLLKVYKQLIIQLILPMVIQEKYHLGKLEI